MNESIMRQARFDVEMDLVKETKCPLCTKDVKIADFKNQTHVDEYKISGMCPPCQDKFFVPQEDDGETEDLRSRCPFCQEPTELSNFKDPVNIKVYKKTGICLKCQDKGFAHEVNDDDYGQERLP